MKKILLCSALCMSTITASASNLNSESDINRLISPSFAELQSEYIFKSVTCYEDVPDKLIDRILDKHFQRIEFMCFITKEKQ